MSRPTKKAGVVYLGMEPGRAFNVLVRGESVVEELRVLLVENGNLNVATLMQVGPGEVAQDRSLSKWMAHLGLMAKTLSISKGQTHFPLDLQDLR